MEVCHNCQSFCRFVLAWIESNHTKQKLLLLGMEFTAWQKSVVFMNDVMLIVQYNDQVWKQFWSIRLTRDTTP